MSKRSLAIMLSAALFVAVFVGGVAVSVLSTPAPIGVEIDPIVASADGPVKEGDAATVPFSVVNRTAEWAELTSISAGCSCTGFLQRDGKPFKAPVSIGPHSRLELVAVINTSGRTGWQEVATGADVRVAGRQITCAARLRALVLTGWRLNPTELNLETSGGPSPITRTIELFDGNPDPGIQLKAIRSSDPKRLTTVFKEVGTTPSDGKGEPPDLKKRYDIKVMVNPGPSAVQAEWASELLTLVPLDPARPERSIAVRWWNRRPGPTLVPPTLTVILPKESGVVRRRIKCISNTADNRELHVVKKPEFITLTIAKNEDRSKEITVECKIGAPQAMPSRSEVQFAVGESDATALLLPINFVKAP